MISPFPPFSSPIEVLSVRPAGSAEKKEVGKSKPFRFKNEVIVNVSKQIDISKVHMDKNQVLIF